METSLKKLKEELSGRVELEVENEELKLKVEALANSHKALETRCEELMSFIEQMREAGRSLEVSYDGTPNTCKLEVLYSASC